MKWKEKKEELERFINEEKKSYEELGRYYGVTGTAVKRACERLGIELPKRRKVNPNETFNRGTAKKGVCLNCGKEFILYLSSSGKYCSSKCQNEYQHKQYIEKWKSGEVNGLNGEYYPSKHIRTYLFKKNENKCEKCGWGEVNPYTNRVPLQIHHIDGNCQNNREENLQLLCPNCHALTENFGSRNKNATEGRTAYYKKDK